MSRKQELNPVSKTDEWMERANKQLTHRRADEEDKRERSVTAQRVVEVDVEINIIDNAGVGDNQKAPAHPVQQCSKRKSTTPQRVRRKPHANHTPTIAMSSSLSRASIISDTAAEELCDLRNYYSKQLRRINYISHEHLGQPAEPGVLACIREPLKSLRLPRKVTIAQTARSLWTRVSGRRKLGHAAAWSSVCCWCSVYCHCVFKNVCETVQCWDHSPNPQLDSCLFVWRRICLFVFYWGCEY